MVLGLAVPLYSCSINASVIYSLQHSPSATNNTTNPTRHDWTRLEVLFHFICITLPLSLAIYFAITDAMEPRGNICLVPTKFSIYLTGFIIASCVLFCIFSTIYIYRYAQWLYKRNNPDRVNDIQDKTMEAFKYAMAFLLTFLFPYIRAIITFTSPTQDARTELDILVAIFYPLQGFWNFIFFVRPTIKQLASSSNGISFWKAIQYVLFHQQLDQLLLALTNKNSTSRHDANINHSRGKHESTNIADLQLCTDESLGPKLSSAATQDQPTAMNNQTAITDTSTGLSEWHNVSLNSKTEGVSYISESSAATKNPPLPISLELSSIQMSEPSTNTTMADIT